jgi:glycosyltransferase involved in cell wall biosynthesis
MGGMLAMKPLDMPLHEASVPPLRILYHHRVVSRDGQSVHVDDMIAALRHEGHSVSVAAPAGLATQGLGAEAPRWVSALKSSLPAALYEAMELGYNFPAFVRLYRNWRRFKPDVIYERYNLNLLAGIFLAKLTRTPLLLEVNAPLAQERARFDGIGFNALATRLESWVWRQADHVLPVSAVLAAHLAEAGVDPQRITVIPNAIDTDVYDGIDAEAAKRALGLSGKIVLGFSGFMREWHGLDALMDVLSQPDLPPELHVLFVGDGPARAGMEQKAAALGIADRMTFTGVVPRDRIAQYIAAFDIALQPQAVGYASPLKLFEYMAAGKAIVAPSQPNIRELLAAEESALLFDPDQKDAMLATLLRLVRDARLRRRLGQAARQQIDVRGFTWADHARRVAAMGAASAEPNSTTR